MSHASKLLKQINQPHHFNEDFNHYIIYLKTQMQTWMAYRMSNLCEKFMVHWLHCHICTQNTTPCEGEWDCQIVICNIIDEINQEYSMQMWRIIGLFANKLKNTLNRLKFWPYINNRNHFKINQSTQFQWQIHESYDTYDTYDIWQLWSVNNT